MNVAEKLQSLISDYKQVNNELPALVACHPDTHLKLRRILPTWQQLKGYHEAFGVEIFASNHYERNEFNLFPLPQKHNVNE